MERDIKLNEEEALIPVRKYVFLLVNPKSGDKKGAQLSELSIQHFRMKEDLSVQAQIYDITDESSMHSGLSYLLQLQNDGNESKQLHVWSGGGDGTIVGVIEKLVDFGLNIDKLIFSCIPFGTGNDFSQALGWGKTLDEEDIVGPNCSVLERLILERLDDDNSNLVKLDVWDCQVESYPEGYIEEVKAKDKPTDKVSSLNRKMCVYFALGVQGFVGSGFEINRKESRFLNFFTYLIESIKWVAFKKFPSVTNQLKSVSNNNDKEVLHCKPLSSSKKLPEANAENGMPTFYGQAIEFVIQNIPRIWSRNIDLWQEANDLPDPFPHKPRLPDIMDRKYETKKESWTPQSTSDSKLEVFAIASMRDYIQLQLPKRKEPVLQIGQFENKVTFNFREEAAPLHHSRNRFRTFFRPDIPKDSNLTCVMVDGEFFKLYKPKSITFKLYNKIWVRANSVDQSRVARDFQD